MKIITKLMILMGIVFSMIILGVTLDGMTDGRYSLKQLSDTLAYILAGIKVAEWVSAREKKGY